LGVTGVSSNPVEYLYRLHWTALTASMYGERAACIHRPGRREWIEDRIFDSVNQTLKTMNANGSGVTRDWQLYEPRLARQYEYCLHP
jgi:hypothetical protein